MKLYSLDNKLIEETNNIPDNFTGIVERDGREKYWLSEDKLHRIGGPAWIWADGNEEWWIDNEQVTKEQHDLLYDIMKLKGLL